MEQPQLTEMSAGISTANIADACVRLKLPTRVAPPGIRPVLKGHRLAGPALPVRHFGSVDTILEAIYLAAPGDVLVVDNGARLDESCIGDLIAMEAQACALSGIVIWGLHRDTSELEEIGLPVFSYGANPFGPRRLDPCGSDAIGTASLGDFTVHRGDIVFADPDGVVFVSSMRVAELLSVAQSISRKEREQRTAIGAGTGLRQQLRFDEYLALRASDPAYTFREHLRALGGAIEE